MDRTVGVVGLGIMGGAIARNLAERGWRVVGADIDPDRQEALGRLGVEIVADAAHVARRAPVVLLSLPHAEALRDATSSIADAHAPSRIVVETGTLPLDEKTAFAQAMREAGHTPLDCPLSGTGAQAARRDLVVYASGASSAIATCAPIFGDFAKQVVDLGAFGNGSRMKFVANLLVAIHNVAAAEAMTLATMAGLDPDAVIAAIAPGAGGSRMFEMRAPMMARGEYTPATMRVATWAKDMKAIAEFARSLGAATPCFDATAPVYAEALAAGFGEMDTAAVRKIIARRSRQDESEG